MAQFDVPGSWGVKFFASRDAFYQQKYTIERRVALSGGAWQKVGADHWPGEVIICGPLPGDPNLEYQILAYHRLGGPTSGQWVATSKERVSDDFTLGSIAFEDATDADFNDLIVSFLRKKTFPVIGGGFEPLFGDDGEKYYQLYSCDKKPTEEDDSA